VGEGAGIFTCACMTKHAMQREKNNKHFFIECILALLQKGATRPEHY
jgi:hypothetical protein